MFCRQREKDLDGTRKRDALARLLCPDGRFREIDLYAHTNLPFSYSAICMQHACAAL